MNGLFDIWASDLNEKRGEAIAVNKSELELEFRPFEIKTLILRRRDS